MSGNGSDHASGYDGTEVTYRAMIVVLALAILILLTVGLVTQIQVSAVNKSHKSNDKGLDSEIRMRYDGVGGWGQVEGNVKGNEGCTVDEMMTAIANNRPEWCN